MVMWYMSYVYMYIFILYEYLVYVYLHIINKIKEERR